MSGIYDNPSEGRRVGQVIGDKYRIVRFLGCGGMGEVYEARHAVVGRRFAIKVLHQHLAQAAGGEFAVRFVREAQAAGCLEQENVAAVVDFGTSADGTYFFAMEYLDGESLATLLGRSGPLSAPRAARLVAQACRGVSAAHGVGIIHRDLKPDNLFLCRQANGADLVKVLDFGIAKVRSDVTLTHSGMLLGTACYMSPEQARGAKSVDYRTDVYSLGAVLYELLTGVRAHPGETYNEVLLHVLTQEPVSLATLRPDLPDGLAATVEKAMAREADERFSTMNDFERALSPFASLALGPKPEGGDPDFSASPGGAVHSITEAPLSSSARPKRSHTSKQGAILAGTSLTVVAALAVWARGRTVVTPSGTSPPPPTLSSAQPVASEGATAPPIASDEQLPPASVTPAAGPEAASARPGEVVHLPERSSGRPRGPAPDASAGNRGATPTGQPRRATHSSESRYDRHNPY